MTTITIERFEPGTPSDIPAQGYVRFEPTKSRISGGSVILPLPFTVALVNGQATVELAPTTDWTWQVTYMLRGLVHKTRFYIVPDSPTPIADKLLVEVDPVSMEPEGTPGPGWYSYVDSLAGIQAAVVRVVTGEEPRLPFAAVFWIGGTTQPTNMAEGTDIWFKAAS